MSSTIFCKTYIYLKHFTITVYYPGSKIHTCFAKCILNELFCDLKFTNLEVKVSWLLLLPVDDEGQGQQTGCNESNEAIHESSFLLNIHHCSEYQ